MYSLSDLTWLDYFCLHTLRYQVESKKLKIFTRSTLHNNTGLLKHAKHDVIDFIIAQKINKSDYNYTSIDKTKNLSNGRHREFRILTKNMATKSTNTVNKKAQHSEG